MRREARVVTVLVLVLVASMAAAPNAGARESDAPREARTTILLLLAWQPENVGISNFSREATTPQDALASFTPDVVRTLRVQWARDPRITAADVEAADAAVLAYCLHHNGRVFGRLVDERLVGDLHRVAPGARVEDGPDGTGLVLVGRVPESSIDALLRLPYVANVGHADARFAPAQARASPGGSAAHDAKADAAAG